MKYIVTQEVRDAQSLRYLIWAAINTVVPLSIVGLLVLVQSEIDIACEKHIRVWLVGMIFIFIVHSVKKVILIAAWNTSENPRDFEQQVNVIYIAMFSLPELVWYGYGSLMIYSSEMDACKNSEDSTQ